MYHKSIRVVALALAIVFLMSVSVFAETDISGNYAGSSAIFESIASDIANGDTDAVSDALNRASTFQATDRSALISAEGYVLPENAPAELAANRKALLELITAEGMEYKDYIRTLTVRVPGNYSLDYGTLTMDRATMDSALSEGFTDVVFENDFFSLRLSMVDYLPLVPASVEYVTFFVGETRNDVPQAILDKAQSMPILVVKEYRNGMPFEGEDYSKNAVALIVKNAMYNVSGRAPSECLFYTYDLDNDTVSKVSGYLYSALTDTASFAKGDSDYFLFLPKEEQPSGSEGGNGGNEGGNGGNEGGNGGNGGDSGDEGEVTPPVVEPPVTVADYDDVAQEHWAYSSIMTLSGRGIISGVGNNLFDPEASVTREQFAKLLAAGFELTGEEILPFTDVPQNDWAYPFIVKVYVHGIARGIGNDLFGYGAQITRQDMAVMLYKAMSLEGELNVEASGELFADDAEIADYAREAVYAMRTLGIINGNPDGTFCPNDSATRAQAAKMLCAAMGL